MQNSIHDSEKSILNNPVIPLKEMAAYEALWARDRTTYNRLSQKFKENPYNLPSDFVSESEIKKFKSYLESIIKTGNLPCNPFILINNTFDYPYKLRDAKQPIEILYYMGNLDYLNTKCIAVVGAREATPEGKRRAVQLVRNLVKDDFTIVSGLAKGIDSIAHQSAIQYGGRTIGVIGTPLNKHYPKEHENLQNQIAKDHLLISQVPFWKYEQMDYRWNRKFFPERNKTMSALTLATIIVEASDTSGTLTQAKAALYQKRKLFILDSCFQNPSITWPHKFAEKGAIRVKNYEDIKIGLNE